MLDQMLAAVHAAQQREHAHGTMLMLKLAELVLAELERHGYELPDGDPLPDSYGAYNGSYKDTIKLWYTDGSLCYHFYYPSRGTGSSERTGRFVDADRDIQNRTFRLLYDAWRKLACEADSRMGTASRQVRNEMANDREGKRRDAEHRKQVRALNAPKVEAKVEE